MNTLLKPSVLLLIVLIIMGCQHDELTQEESTSTDYTTKSTVVNAKLKATRISGAAPLAVQFRAIGTTHKDQNLDTFKALGYHFTFGDPGSGTWKHSGKSKNSQIGGPIAAHVFETPGTYTVSVRAQDATGNFSDASVTITVTDPNTVYSGANTVVISTNTDVTGAPNGAQLLTNQTNWPVWESGKRYLLMSGQDFTAFGNIKLFQKEDVQVGKNGTGADPVVGNVGIDTGRLPVGNFSKRIAISDLYVGDVQVAAGTDIAFIRGTNASFFVGGTVEYWVENGTQDQADNLKWPENIFMYEATNIVRRTNYVVSVAAQARGFNILGSELANSVQHNIRPYYLINGLIAHNHLYGAATSKVNIKLQGDGLVEKETEPLAKNSLNSATRWVVITDNKIGDGSAQKNVWAIAVQPENGTLQQGVQDVIVENNNFVSDFQREVVLGGRRLTERGSTSSGPHSAITSNRIDHMPASWDGPYVVDGEQIIPDEPGS
jgi:hypothetical protein